MRTTADIHEARLNRARAFAGAAGKRLSDVINEALTELISRREEVAARTRSAIELPAFGGSGFQPGIDPTSNASLMAACDEPTAEPANVAELDRRR